MNPNTDQWVDYGYLIGRYERSQRWILVGDGFHALRKRCSAATNPSGAAGFATSRVWIPSRWSACCMGSSCQLTATTAAATTSASVAVATTAAKSSSRPSRFLFRSFHHSSSFDRVSSEPASSASGKSTKRKLRAPYLLWRNITNWRR